MNLLDPMALELVIDPATGDSYKWLSGSTSDVTDLAGLAGQGGVNNPKSLFGNHQFVQVQVGGVTKWWDPSYGIEYAGTTESARLLAVDDGSVAGYGTVRLMKVREQVVGVDLNGDGDLVDATGASDITQLYVLLFRKNAIGTRELNRE